MENRERDYQLVTITGERVGLPSEIEFDVNVSYLDPKAETDQPREIIDTWIESVFSSDRSLDVTIAPSHKKQAMTLAEEQVVSC